MAQDALVWLEKILKDERELYDNFPEELLFDDGEVQIGDNITELQELIDDLDDWVIRLSELHDTNDDFN
mgnify:FL=1